MLKTLLNLFSILSLVCAGLVLMLCANQWLEYAHSKDNKCGVLYSESKYCLIFEEVRAYEIQEQK